MEKILLNLEELREVCKFVTEIGTGEDNKKFDKIILEDKSHYLMHLNHKNFNLHNLSKLLKILFRKKWKRRKRIKWNIRKFKYNGTEIFEVGDRIIRLLNKIRQNST